MSLVEDVVSFQEEKERKWGETSALGAVLKKREPSLYVL